MAQFWDSTQHPVRPGTGVSSKMAQEVSRGTWPRLALTLAHEAGLTKMLPSPHLGFLLCQTAEMTPTARWLERSMKTLDGIPGSR